MHKTCYDLVNFSCIYMYANSNKHYVSVTNKFKRKNSNPELRGIFDLNDLRNFQQSLANLQLIRLISPLGRLGIRKLKDKKISMKDIQ